MTVKDKDNGSFILHQVDQEDTDQTSTLSSTDRCQRKGFVSAGCRERAGHRCDVSQTRVDEWEMHMFDVDSWEYLVDAPDFYIL